MTEEKIDEKIDVFEFDIDAMSSGASGEAFTPRPARAEKVEIAVSGTGSELEMSPVFKLLARPTLPELKHEARARLMMQSPTRLYFYWSISSHSYQALQQTLGDNVNDYRLALRLLDLTNETEELHAIEPEGSWWFKVQPDTEYRAEIGFYSASRPWVRILFSNTLQTPRKSPSPHSSAEAKWAVTTHNFAEVLDASGFEADAVDVLHEEHDTEIASIFADYVGIDESHVNALNMLDLKRSLASLAAGTPIEDLKYKIGAELYALLQQHLARLSAESIRSEFGITDSDAVAFESLSAVGGSLVNIPRRRFRPVSSSNQR
jgi:hypothetical protein